MVLLVSYLHEKKNSKCNFYVDTSFESLGLMMKNGYWYSFETNAWEAALFPPYPTFIPEPDALFGYRGQPTIFGNPTCNSEDECEGLDVIQYDSDENAWYNIGEMTQQRRFHTVFEVPSSFCAQAEPPPTR